MRAFILLCVRIKILDNGKSQKLNFQKNELRPEMIVDTIYLRDFVMNFQNNIKFTKIT
jgi:hypothetical protein